MPKNRHQTPGQKLPSRTGKTGLIAGSSLEKSDTEPGGLLPTKKTCSRDGAGNRIRCSQPAKKRGRCPKHYQQWHRLQAKCRADGCSRIQVAHYHCRPHERLALWLAHRFSYVWFYGGHATGKVLDHLCNVSRCVRPDHLWPITNTNNLSLMHQRALAGELEYWRHARITPYSVALIRWARANQLPWGKPAVATAA